jgi:hypothetical protein
MMLETLQSKAGEGEVIEKKENEIVAALPLCMSESLLYMFDNEILCDVIFIMKKNIEDSSQSTPTPKLSPELLSAELPSEFLEWWLTSFRLTSKCSSRKSVPGRLPAHRLVLAAASSVFEEMFFGLGTHTRARARKWKSVEVIIRDVVPGVFLDFLTCIYTDQLLVKSASIIDLIELGQRYQVPKIRSICSEFLQRAMTPEHALKLFCLAPVALDDPAFGMPFVCEWIDDLVRGEDFLKLPPSRLAYLLGSDQLQTEEITLFRYVLKWAETRASKLGEPVKSMIEPMLPFLR